MNIDDKNVTTFKIILSKCPNISHIDFTYTIIKINLVSSINLCPKL